MATGKDILTALRPQLDLADYRKMHWEGSFEDYLSIIIDHPEVTRTAYQRLYDMVMSHGTEEVYENKEKVTRYKFFTEFAARHGDAVFGIDRPVTQLINTFKSAAKGYGTERRVLLLHGPVGSAKSTIARLLKRGIEEYSRTDGGMLFSFSWKNPDGTWVKDPMHGEPLQLIPMEHRARVLEQLNADCHKPYPYAIAIKGDLSPFSRFEYRERLARYDGDWIRMLSEEVKVYRLLLSEQDRIGIGTFQPKDEKNQDSTELTGDINYRKIAEYGSDSDPRAFNFDGELNIANRGIVEFIEVLKLDVAFLYDLLGASQEHKIKPKKFAQTDIDEVILGHSVAGETPIAFRHDGRPGWTTLEQLYERFADDADGLEVLSHDFANGRTDWTPVRSVIRHKFTGTMVTTSQKWGAVETTPNHSVFGRDGEPFYPHEGKELMAVRGLHAEFADPTAVVDVAEGVPGFVRDAVTVGGRQRAASRWMLDPLVDVGPLTDVVAGFARYAAGGETAIDPRVCEYHCGTAASERRLPDFLFGLPSAYLEVAFAELTRGGELTTPSALLAAQVGTLASLLGRDYAVRQTGDGWCVELGGTGEAPSLAERPVEDVWVYDIEDVAGLHNFVCGVGNVVCSNTNEPEYRRLQNNEFMEALRDRTVKIDVPYVTRLRDEIRIYEKDFNPERVKGKHIAPHTIEIAAMWAVLTRLTPPKHANLTLLQKLKLYNGKTLPGFTEDNVTELKREAVNEGMHGISPRYIQDKISNALVAHPEEDSVNPFMVLQELEAGLRHHSLINDQEQLQHYRELLQVVREEYEDIVKNEVQRAIAADEDALARLCANYIDNVKAYTQREKVRNRYTGNFEDPDERLMRSVEEKIDIPDGRKDDFRREIMNYIGALAIDGKRFDYKTNERLQKALELKLFEDQKDSIKLTSLVQNVVDRATQEKIDVVKARLIRNYGYNESSATDVLTFVASIFARGQTRK